MSYAKMGFWVTVVGVVIAFGAWVTNRPTINTEIEDGNNQIAQGITMDGKSSFAQVQNTYNYYLDEKAVKKLEEENKPIGEVIKQYNSATPQFSDRPKVVTIPTATVTNWPDGSIVYGEKLDNGCITASFDVKLLNIGGKIAKDLKTTKWTILDNGFKITGFNEWLEFIKQQPYVKDILPPGTMYNLIYGPHIGAAGKGNLKLIYHSFGLITCGSLSISAAVNSLVGASQFCLDMCQEYLDGEWLPHIVISAEDDCLLQGRYIALTSEDNYGNVGA